MRSLAAFVVAVSLALSLDPLPARADEPTSAPASSPAPADAPLRAIDTPAAAGDGPAPGFTFGVQVAGGLGASFSFLGLGVGAFGVPLSVGFVPGFLIRGVHLRLVLAFARDGSRTVNDFMGTRIVNGNWTTAFTAMPELEITLLTLGALRAFVMGGVAIGLIDTLSRTDDGMTVTRNSDTDPAYGALAGFGFRVMLSPAVGLGATGGLQWFAVTSSMPGSTSRSTDQTFNGFATIDVTAFFGGM